MLGINLGESTSTVNSYMNTHSLTYPVLKNGNSVYNSYGNGYIPYNVIIGQDGLVKYTTSGFSSSTILSHLNTLTTGVNDGSTLPDKYKLMGNYPNPFNNGTLINYQLPASSHVKIDIFSSSGDKIKTLLNTNVPAGEHGQYWDGRNDSGIPVSSGLYFYKFRAGNYTEVKKMMILK